MSGLNNHTMQRMSLRENDDEDEQFKYLPLEGVVKVKWAVPEYEIYDYIVVVDLVLRRGAIY